MLKPTSRFAISGIVSAAVSSILASAAFSAEPEVAAAADDALTLTEVMVTGTRVARDGFTAPTPTTVLSVDEILARGVSNITEAINEIPAFRPSQTPAAAARGGSTNGGSFLDLRGLNGQGPTAVARTLVLVDGRRFVSSNAKGQVDMNLIPTSLIERTEVVTGGASAAWGSDAITGVVNLILKDRLQGLQGSLGFGRSSHDDFKEISANLAGGTSFAGGRGHVIAGIEFVDNQGVPDPAFSRAWGRTGYSTLTLPASRPAGTPSRVLVPDVRFSDRMTPGGIVVGGPLDNLMFLPNGQTATFIPGSLVGGLQMAGGGAGIYGNEGLQPNAGSNLINPIKRYSALGRVGFDLTDSTRAFVELSHGESQFRGISASRRDSGSLVIRRDNAFLPESVRQQMIDLNLQTINVGRVAMDDNFGGYSRATDQATDRVVFGLQGKLGEGWSWDTYYQWGENHLTQNDPATIVSNYVAAVDAVFDGDGNIVCRPGPTNIDAGCVPFNIFGQNSPSQAAVDYVLGVGTKDEKTSQQVWAANVTGSPFEIWAGPVSVAAGLEYRNEKHNAVVDNNSRLLRFDLGNYQPLKGSYSTKEVYGEVVVPLLRDMPGAKTLELNSAIRYTDYSTSGDVTTWKVGLLYEPIHNLKFRATQSRDIRAPNISELFTGLSSGTRINPANPWQNGTPNAGLRYSSGNMDLRPEKADTLTAGVLYQPEWYPGLRMAIDYYRIKIDDVITQIPDQLIIDRCYSGADPSLCSFITLSPSLAIESLISPWLNFNSLKTSGVDFEVAANLPTGRLLPGQLSVRAFGTYVSELVTTEPTGAIDRVRSTVPEWAANLSLTYRLNRLSTTAQMRYIGAGIRNVLLVGPDDPAYNPASASSIDNNLIGSVTYTNLSAQYDVFERDNAKVQIFGVVNNLFDRDPPIGTGISNQTGAVLYDLVGRSFKLGVRFSL